LARIQVQNREEKGKIYQLKVEQSVVQNQVGNHASVWIIKKYSKQDEDTGNKS